MIRALWQALVGSSLRAQPGRALLAALAIAAGIALGYSVHLLNASADAEFRRAALQLSGEAELLVRGPRQGFDEQLYPRIASLDGIAIASPVLEFQASRDAGKAPLRIIGVDALRARELQPALVAGQSLPAAGLFDPDSIILSAAAARSHGVSVGDSLDFRAGTATVALRIAAVLPDGSYRQSLGIMDIAAAQWRFGMTGVLHRIDIRLDGEVPAAAVQESISALLPEGVELLTPDAENLRSAALTRAYRTNLDMLALIALFTGAFLVYSTQTLAMLRRRTEVALLRALGAPRRTVLGVLIAEGALIGAAGAVIGIAGGFMLARQLLATIGTDLGAGYFRSLQATLHPEPATMLFFLLLGPLFALGGTLAPAIDIAGMPPARSLRAGDPDERTRAFPLLAGIAAIGAAAMLLWAAPSIGLPLHGHAAIALLLAGATLAFPPAAIRVLRLARLRLPLPHALSLARLLATPRLTAISMSSILVSFSLVASMLLMIHSFRTSLDDWLDRMLPADVYVRAGGGGETAFLSEREQQRIASIPQLLRVEFLRSRSLLLLPGRPPVTLIARDPGVDGLSRSLPLVDAPATRVAGGPPPVWISELVADLLALRPGDPISLPLGTQPQIFSVAGIWRDYARQNGAVVISLEDYRRITGEHKVNDVAAWLAPDAGPAEVSGLIRAATDDGSALEITATADLRRLSLDIFDRSFAVTWALQAAALCIGLLGVWLAFNAQALSRRREFGMLRHLGLTRREISAMLAGEGALGAAIGAACGMVAGGLIGLILVRVINRQSFHWSMDLAIPWLPLAALFTGIILCAAVAACAGAAMATRQEMTRAVREDW
jgi:putative ABC transport system permease protein